MLERPGDSTSVAGDGGLPLKLPTRIISYAWGEKYVGELLAMAMPALLAPGNLPYVASVLECELIILTEERFFGQVLNDPTVCKIRELCRVRLIGLDDLIPTPDKYGMALTYVLHRGFSDLGPAVTDTWLMFLNSDFVLADGSLRNLVRHLSEGKRLIASPSYCVNGEAVNPELLKRVDPKTRTLSLTHREMAGLVLRHRHNTIRGKTVNQPFVSFRYMDQFYWLVDHATLIGRQMPIAIVGMRPERHLDEPNSYWDHGLMREFFPTTEHFVLGDSDEFLMLELRGANVAREHLRTGWADPSEIARDYRSFLTTYQKDMARYPLTLHSGDLPPSIDEARAKLQAFIDGVFAHVPAVLPSHLGHPQWEYHRPGFIEIRHKHLSRRLGSTTETSEPPASLSEIDKVWWKLDGVTKFYERRRAELTDLANRQRSAMDTILSQMEDEFRAQRKEGDARLMNELREMRIHPQDTTVPFNRVVECSPDQPTIGLPETAGDHEAPWVTPILRDAEEWRTMETEARQKVEILTQAKEFVDRQYQDELVRLATLREQLQAEYDDLVKRRISSAAIPDVAMRRGPLTAAGSADNRLIRLARQRYHRHYGKLPRVQLTHPYWAAMRHLIRLVDAAAANGAANVLVVVGSGGVGDTVADHLPGLHGQVSLQELMQGNLAKSFNEPPEFDLCICTLGPGELGKFAEIANQVRSCLRQGGRILGFYPNFQLSPISVEEIEALQSLLSSSSSGRIYYAGSKESARVLDRFNRALLRDTSSRVSRLLRIGTTLLLITPPALVANRLEAAVSEEQASRMPERCTSVTIDVTV